LSVLGELPARLSEPTVMSQLLQALDEGARTPVASLLEGVFSELRPSALVPLVGWLGTATASPVRAAIERASLRLAGANASELARLLEHTDVAVVRGALRLSAQLATPAAVPGLAKLLRGDDAKMRIDAVAALGDIGSTGALQALERGIDDVDREVRVATFRALTARKHAGALPKLAQALRRKELRVADLGEKMALFEAYGTLCGDAGVPELDQLLNARGLLGAREPAELRACAARALGLVNTAAANGALQRASDTKDVVVRSAVMRAMRGAA
jgi:HEAT repeat protein